MGQNATIDPFIKRGVTLKHEEISLQTKKALAASLKKFMRQKPFTKITVSELINDCQVNRKTFYYHFENINALLKWLLEQEAIDVVRGYNLLTDAHDATRFVIDYLDQNTQLLRSAYDSLGRDELKRLFFHDFNGIVLSLIDASEKDMGLSIAAPFKDFLAAFYTEALVGTMINYFQASERPDKDTVLENVLLICQSAIPATLEEKAKANASIN